jgi:hypothetical protein
VGRDVGPGIMRSLTIGFHTKIVGVEELSECLLQTRLAKNGIGGVP